MTALRVGTLAYPVTRIASWEAFAAKIDALVADAAPRADLLIMPEYAAMEIAAIEGGDVRAELAFVAAHADALDAIFADAARRHGVWLIPGSYPRTQGGAVRNEAPLIDPGGRIARQQKHVMTRFETEAWGVRSGAAPRVFATPWGRIGIAICYDCEFPSLVRAQAEAGAFLICVPTCTDTPHGFARVQISARARAVENQCFVAVSPTVGDAPHLQSLDRNTGTAGVYGPCDRGFPADGVIAEGAPDTPGWVFATLDPVALEAVRDNGAVRNFRDWPSAPGRAECADRMGDVPWTPKD